ncbi:MAG: heavy-metal-associated domain-containing protein [Gemmatimonadota bacterium]
MIQVKILGMSCPFCAYGAEQKLKKLDGVKNLEVELKSGVATLTMKEGADAPNEKLKQLVEDAGFEADAIVRNFESEYEDWRPKKMPGKGQGSEATSSGATSGTPLG